MSLEAKQKKVFTDPNWWQLTPATVPGLVLRASTVIKDICIHQAASQSQPRCVYCNNDGNLRALCAAHLFLPNPNAQPRLIVFFLWTCARKLACRSAGTVAMDLVMRRLPEVGQLKVFYCQGQRSLRLGTCDTCSRFGQMKRCSVCKCARYCSTRCQKTALVQHRGIGCEALRRTLAECASKMGLKFDS